MEIKIYAPVIIPTLNRYDHFRQCIESLENCTGADKTDVYIGLDFPPSEKYVEGWKKIDDYLKDKECSNKFKQFVVFRREHNCGIGNENSNSNLLRKYISKNYDRYIFSEDDNVFSPNFLEFINKGLQLYKDTPDIFAVCGYCEPLSFKSQGNNFFFHRTNFSAWGYGVWTDKILKVNDEIDGNFFKNTFSWTNLLREKKYGSILYAHYCRLLGRKDGFIPKPDRTYSVYMHLKKMSIVCPVLPKVHNIGWDNLGNSFQRLEFKGDLLKKRDMYNSQTQDSDVFFEYTGNPYIFEDYNNALASQMGKHTISSWKLVRITFSSLIRYYIHKII